MIFPELTVTNHEMYVHRHGDDEHQGDKVRGNNRDLPTDKPQQTHHQQASIGTTDKRQYYPALTPENDAEHNHQKCKDTKTEYHEIILDKSNHVIRNHRDTTQVQGPIMPIGFHDVSYFHYGFVVLISEFLLP